MKHLATALLLCVFSLSLLAEHTGGPARAGKGPTATQADITFLEENFPLSKEDAEWFAGQLLDESTAGTAAAELILSLDETEEHKDQTAFHDKISAEPGPEGLSEDLKKALKWGAIREKTEKHSDKASEEFKKKYDEKRKEKLDCNKTYNDTQEKFKKGEMGYNEAKKELQKCEYSDDVLQKYSGAKYNQNVDRATDLPDRAADALFLSGTNNGGRVVVDLSVDGIAKKIELGFAAVTTQPKPVPPLHDTLSKIWTALTTGKGFDSDNPVIKFGPTKGTGGTPMIWKDGAFKEDKDWANSPVPPQFPKTKAAEIAKHPIEALLTSHAGALESCNKCHNDTLEKLKGFKKDHAALVTEGKGKTNDAGGDMEKAVEKLPQALINAINDWARLNTQGP